MGKYLIGFGVIGIFCVAGIFAHGEPEIANSEKSATPTTGYQAPEHLRIAVVDIGYIFKNSKWQTSKMEALKKKVADAEDELHKQQAKIAALQEKEKSPDLDSPARDAATTEILELTGLLSTQTAVTKKQFMEDEASLYYKTMQDIKEEIRNACRQHDIQVVLRINKDPIDPSSRVDILRDINDPIQYFDSNLDITEEVLAAVNAKESESAN
jgi:Skp family chaperone for outer membrane proteins